MSNRDDLIDEYGRAETAPLGTLADLRVKLDAYRAEVLREAAEVAVRTARACGDTEAGQYAASVAAGVGKELRRMADAAGKDTSEGESTRDDEPPPGWTATCGKGQSTGCLCDAHDRDLIVRNRGERP